MGHLDMMLSAAAQAPDTQASEPYPLTVMQQAYWIGEQEGYSLHTPACLYRGYHTPELDLGRLQEALLSLMRAHPTLRTCFHHDGTQSIAAMPQAWHLPVRELRQHDVAAQAEMVAARKDEIDAHLPALDSGLQFACFVDRVHDGFHVHFLFRLLTLDGRSLAVFFRDLTLAYQGHALDPAQAADYRTHVRRQEALRRDMAYQHALAYWTERLPSLPAAPDLPIREHEHIPARSRFQRLQLRLDPAEVRQLTLQVRKLGATPNAVLCTLFADVLRMWARNPSFTLNLLISGRPTHDERFAHTIGNFSSTLLLEIPVVQGRLRDRVAALQTQLFREVEHKDVSGVEVIRHMSRPGATLPAMPVVFASTLGLSKEGDTVTQADLGWRPVDSAMHTPQVWLDHQAYMEEGCLILNWDYVEGVFLPGVIEEMFEVYQTYVGQVLSADVLALEHPPLPARGLQARQAANDTRRALPRGLLHDFFFEACCRHPNNTAIIAPDAELSYAELLCHTTTLASRLRQLGVGRNELVGIVARRGWRQVAAAMSVVQSGGAYLPIAFDLPPARQQWLIEQPGVKVVLCEREAIPGLQAPHGVTLLALEDVLPDAAPYQPVELASIQGPEDLAYVIFTSGSTGTPKGVAIDHRGAVNTIQDVIARFGLDSSDRVIGISAFNFDLSVYDIFGTLGCGATLVLPPHTSTPSPADWARCVQRHGVTVWNSVPALLEMQIEFSGAKACEQLASLRLVMLSGDWIPVSLPGRLSATVPGAVLVSMGGATEASIWSNYFVVKQVDPAWRSIPYGWPLSNQSFHVLDDALRPVPTWAVGHLYIGGIGLAQGYYRDAERTAKSFITHPQTGERLYRTGDLGRYHPSGHLEFLGRSDSQVKVHGHRIELGEIDAALERCHGLRGGAAVVRSVGQHDRQLLAFYVRDPGAALGQGAVMEAAIRQHLAATLPHYMVPGLLVELDQMPVTANGKVDRNALQARAAAVQVARATKVTPRNQAEATLSALWQDLLGVAEPGVHEDFFELGGSSLMAVRLLNAIEAAFGQTLPLASLLRHGSIAKQAELLQARHHGRADDEGKAQAAQVREAVVPIRLAHDGQVQHRLLVVVHPVGGNVLCYRPLLGHVPADVDVIGIQSRGDGAARTLPEMASSYVQALLPYFDTTRQLYLLGWSMGGVLAQEMARQLEQAGVSIAALTMVDSWTGAPGSTSADVLQGFPLLKSFVGDLLQDEGLPADFEELALLPASHWPAALKAVLSDTSVGTLSTADFSKLIAEHEANFNALIQHQVKPTRIKPRQYHASRHGGFPFLAPFSMPEAAFVAGTPGPDLQVYLNETHFSIFQGDCLRHIAASTFNQGAKA